MRRVALFIVITAACQVDHHVTLQLGPDPMTLTGGFSCLDKTTGAMPNPPPLLAQNYDATQKSASFVLVIDVIDLGDQVPNCQAENLELACNNNQCQLRQADAPTRFCEPITIDDLATADNILAAIPPALVAQAQDVISSGPHHPVMLRAVALPAGTDCTALQQVTNGVYPAFTPAALDNVLGCAYSCPESLDELDGTVSLELSLAKAELDYAICNPIITACAMFPAASPNFR